METNNIEEKNIRMGIGEKGDVNSIKSKERSVRGWETNNVNHGQEQQNGRCEQHQTEGEKCEMMGDKQYQAWIGTPDRLGPSEVIPGGTGLLRSSSPAIPPSVLIYGLPPK
ncbi:hypothetical protein N7535_008854 [Penicillium sp. DV-2018c]|nr:hypothetical protein N7461_002609 [Penicillium sp. DV-2018c]KAJ5563690.1 hypothetical protein N7535_008854 [Penicillium sp. DV-2018c]